jgi:hypothetical protein
VTLCRQLAPPVSVPIVPVAVRLALQLSVTVAAPNAAAICAALGLLGSAPAAVRPMTGAVLSMTVMVCVNGADTRFPHASLTVQVLVYVPACGQVLPATKAPAVSTGTKAMVQLSEARGANACAAMSDTASLHCTVLSRLPAVVAHIGGVLSTTVIVLEAVEALLQLSVYVQLSV